LPGRAPRRWPSTTRNAASRLLLQLRPPIGREVVYWRVLTQLESANVGDDRPAVGHRHLVRIRGHGAEAVRHHVKEMANRRLPQTLGVIRGWGVEAALDHDPVAIPGEAVARRTVDVEA